MLSTTTRLTAAAAIVAFGATTAFADSDSGGNSKSTTAYANVTANGRLRDSSGVRSVSHNGTGLYRVQFDNGVGGCSKIATISSNGGTGGGGGGGTTNSGLVSVSNSRSDNNRSGGGNGGGSGSDQVRVSTFTVAVTGNTPADLPFDLLVTCTNGK